MSGAQEMVRVPLPTQYGVFEARAFQVSSGPVYLALVKGQVDGGLPVLTRVHSECVTGDVLGSLRCDCGVQLRAALQAVAAEGRGVVVYATGQEGRGVGLVNKLRAYVEQDLGADTVDANLRLGLPVDGRRYDEAAAVLRAIGVHAVRLLTNNPDKVRGLDGAGIEVAGTQPLRTAPHLRNLAYLRTKEVRLGHDQPAGEALDEQLPPPPDVTALLGEVAAPPRRPYLVLKYAQSLDGRIATKSGDARWISSEQERVVSHALRAASDAVMVGVGTVLQDDPQLTVRLVPGTSPVRVVLDSTLRTPPTARVLDGEAFTVILTTPRSAPADRDRLRARDVRVAVVPAGERGVDLEAGLRVLREMGIRSLLTEGGATVITALLSAAVVDRLVVATAPKIIGVGRQGVGDLGIGRMQDSITLLNRSVHLVSDDIVTAWDVPANGDRRPDGQAWS
jgi:GTP cyclohydrolase II